MGQRFPQTSQGLIDVLEQMLEFNPFFRPSANEILQDKLFDEIRQASNEQPA